MQTSSPGNPLRHGLAHGPREAPARHRPRSEVRHAPTAARPHMVNDLLPFEPDAFVAALFADEATVPQAPTG